MGNDAAMEFFCDQVLSDASNDIHDISRLIKGLNCYSKNLWCTLLSDLGQETLTQNNTKNVSKEMDAGNSE